MSLKRDLVLIHQIISLLILLAAEISNREVYSLTGGNFPMIQPLNTMQVSLSPSRQNPDISNMCNRKQTIKSLRAMIGGFWSL